MAEGEVEATGEFKATALGFPPIETRQESDAAAKVPPLHQQALACDLTACSMTKRPSAVSQCQSLA